MNKVICIGEALIDFIPFEKGIMLKDVKNYSSVPGGAPLNVAACISKLGGRSQMITKLGNDGFGDLLVETAKNINVDTTSMYRTDKAKTALAFVSLRENGERDFSFYRNPSADMLLDEKEIKETWFEKGDILHFCSVDLVDAPVKKAHIKAINFALSSNCLVSFDPNLRPILFEDLNYLRDTINDFIPKAHILKISDDELEFITGEKVEKAAVKKLFVGNVKVVLITRGNNGASFIMKHREIFVESPSVDAEDTTGAGDTFIGSFLYQLTAKDLTIDKLDHLDRNEIEQILSFSNAAAAHIVTKKGVIPSLPSLENVYCLLNTIL